MVVDDEEAIRRAFKQALEEAGYNTVTAASGQEALRMLAQNGIEVMLLDMKMPGLSGMEVLERMRSAHPDVAVIMVTAQADVQIAVDAMTLGAYDYATKPVSLDDILFRVKKARERQGLVIRERQHQEMLSVKLWEQEAMLQIQIPHLIENLAREHTAVLELVDLENKKGKKRLLSELPPELRRPAASVEEFTQALMKVIETGGLISKQAGEFPVLEGGGLVMVVDDEESIRGAFQLALEGAGYTTVTVPSGLEALDSLKQQNVEVMLLDMNMPGISGLDVLRIVNPEHPDVAVIMVTALAEVQIAVEAMKAGAYDYAIKPVNLDDILLRVEKARERRWLVIRERHHQEELNAKLKEQEERVEEQLTQLIDGIAREQSANLGRVVLSYAQSNNLSLSKLPSELHRAEKSVKEFAQALTKVLEAGGLKSE